MSELISGKEALIALANGQKVLIKRERWDNWKDLTDDFTLEVFSLNEYQFRLKPSTIYLNGIEVPAPFEPKMNQKYFYLYTENMSGYANDCYEENLITKMRVQFGTWRTEEEIKQVVAALRSVFGKK